MTSPLRLLLSRWRTDLGLLLLLVVVLATTAGLVGAVPRLLDTLQRASLDQALELVTPDRRGVAADRVAPFPNTGAGAGADARGDAVWAGLGAVGEELDATEVEPPLAAVLQDPVPVVESLRWSLGGAPGEEPVDTLTRLLTVRSQLDLPELTLVEGRLPDGLVGERTWEDGEDEQGTALTVTAPVHEVLLTAETAAVMEMAVGDQRVATIDAQGPNARRVVPTPQGRVVLELAGIVELSDVTDEVWFGDTRLHRPAQFDTNQTTIYFGFAVLPPEAVAELPLGRARVVGQAWRWQLVSDGLVGADPQPVREAALTLRTTLAIDLAEPIWSTGLDRLIEREQARRATAIEVLGLAVVALVGVAAALLGAVGVVLATRRRDATALVRGRGTSATQSLVAAAVEAIVVAVVAACLAFGVLASVLPGRGGEGLVLGVVALGAVVLVATSWPDARRPLGALLAERRRGTTASRVGRPVLEGLVVLLATVAVVAVRQRGASADGEVDPLVVVAPAAVALAAAVVAVRFVPLLLRLGAPLVVRTRRGLAAPLGLARATRQQREGPVVLLVTLGVGVAAIAFGVHATIVGGQSTAATERVGADVRIAAPPFGTLDDAFVAPGPDDVVVDVAVVEGSAVGATGGQPIDVVLVDAAGFAELGATDGLPSLAWDGIGAAPLLVSGPLPAVGDLQLGDELTVLADGARIGGSLVGVRPRLLGFDVDEGGPFVVLDAEAVVAATGSRQSASVRLVRSDDAAAVVAAARAADPGAEVLVRDEVRAELRDAPLAAGVRIGYLVAALAVVVATLLAVTLALAAAAPVRRREAAVLSAVGTPDRRIALVAVAEVLPVVGVAALVGVGLSVGVAAVLGATLDLAAFTGTVGPSAVGPPRLLHAVLLTTLVLLVAAAAAVLTIGRVDTAALLREGEG